MRSDMQAIPVGDTISFSLSPGIAFGFAVVTLVVTILFCIRGIFIEKRPLLSGIAILFSLCVFPLSVLVMHYIAEQRHITLDG